jgi:hypothetical protein
MWDDCGVAGPAIRKHPGTIVFVDGNTNTVVSTDRAADLPAEMRFVETRSGLVPVVRVVAFTEGGQRTIREYGPAGELLRSTVQVRGSS